MTLQLLVLINSGCTEKEEHRVLVIHSYEYSYAAYPDFNILIKKAFKDKGIEADIRTVYLDCESHQEQEELDRMRMLLDSLGDWKPEIILVNEDQATYSLLKCGHPLPKQIPVVFAGVNYPNWELIKQYPNVTGFHDKIDYNKTLDVGLELLGKNIMLFTILDYTYLDQAIRADMKEQFRGRKVVGLAHLEFKRQKRDSMRKEGYVYFESIRARVVDASPGGFIWLLSKYVENRCYVQLKRDFTTVNIGNICASPSITAINEAFGYGEKLLGGYITPLNVQISEEVGEAVGILHGTSPGAIPVRESKKVYQIDWNVMQQLHISKKAIPAKYEIINMPFKERYNGLWMTLIVFIVVLLGSIISALAFLYWREQKRKKMALYALEDEKETLALSIEGGNTFAWKLQDDLIVLENAYWKWLGKKTRKVDIDELRNYIHPDHQELFKINKKNLALAKKKIVRLKCDFNGQGYQWWEFRYTTTQLANGQLKTAGLLLNIQEIKDREQELEDARRLAEKAELKQSFLANMSHEIRTPLNAIVGFSNILAMEDELDEADKTEYIDTINRNSELLLKLINDILELSRMESGNMTFQMEKCNVAGLVDKVYMTHKVLIPSYLEFIEERDDTPMEIEVDNDRLTQVLTNFLNNASKFTKEGYIKLGYCFVPEENQVRIYVEDSGIGIPKEEQHIIFSRFYKQNEIAQGTGLGLSISQVIVEKSHGSIELWSELGKGSRFTVVLPCHVIS